MTRLSLTSGETILSDVLALLLQPELSYNYDLVNISDQFVLERQRISVWTWLRGLEQWPGGELQRWAMLTLYAAIRGESTTLTRSPKF